MKKPVSRILSILSSMAVAVVLAASCGGEEPEPTPTPTPGPSPTPTPTTVAVTGVSLNKTTLTLTEGGSETLTATVSPSDATNKNVSWTSSDASVASVSNGQVTAVKPGTASIIVSTADGGKTATCSVTVEAKKVPVTGVTLDETQTSVELVEGEEVTLTATVAPENATDKEIEWTSSDETVATVADGKVTAVAPGTATITVTTKDGGKTAECAVTVVAKTIPVESVTVDKETLELTEGDETVVTATVLPDEATDKTFTWSSSDDEVVTVDPEGNVTAVKAGTATLTVTTTDGEKTATCEVTVEAKVYPVESIEADEATAEALEAGGGKISIVEGQSFQAGITVNPENATNPNVVWTSSDEEVATVDAEGNITAVKPGEATVTATTEDGGFTSDIPVVVTPKPIPVTGVTLNRNALTIAVGGGAQLVATVAPSDATNKNVTWSSSNAKVAKVDENGEVTAVKVGTATITVTTEDGGKTATCEVTVTEQHVAVTGVKLNYTSQSLYVDRTLQLTATISPYNATDHDLTWSSSNDKVATVDKNGKVTAVAPGTATITVKTKNNKSAKCDITVNERYIVYYNGSAVSTTVKYVLGSDTYNYVRFKVWDKVNSSYLSLSALNNVTITSSNTSVANATGSSSDTKLVTAYKVGSTTLTFKHSGRTIKTISLTVSNPDIVLLYSSSLSSLSSSSSQVSDMLIFSKGSTVYLRFYDRDNNKFITTNGYTASSNYPNIATPTVNSSGYVTIQAKHGGNCTVTVSHGNVSKTFKVRVPKTYALTTSTTANVPLTSPQNIFVNDEIKLYFWNVTDNVHNTFESNSTQVTVTSSSSSVASATFYGDYIIIKGLKKGSATIKVKIDDSFGGTMPEKSYVINVKESRYGLVVDDGTYSNGVLLAEVGSSDSLNQFLIKKDGTKRKFLIYDYDRPGSISSKLTTITGGTYMWISCTNNKIHMEYSDTNGHPWARYYADNNPSEGEEGIVTFKIGRKGESAHTVQIKLKIEK